MLQPAYIVVIGASAGGFNAVFEVVKGLKKEMNAAYMVVLHIAKTNLGNYLVSRLQDHTRLKCLLAMDELPIKSGHIYVAAPNHHLIVNKNEIRLGSGAAENRWRPSIDILFRTAAAHYSNRVIGVVLSGMLNDGATGMSAIKRSGGKAIVQDPNEAEYPDMPLSVLKNVDVDFSLPVSQIAEAIESITKNPPGEEVGAPEDIKAEAQISERIITNIEFAQKYGDRSPYTCPDCGGVLFEHNQDTIVRYKCHTGHSYSLRDLALKQSEELEESLWYAIRSLEQKKYLFQTLIDKYKKSGTLRLAADYRKSEEEIESHIKKLKEVLVQHENLKEPE